MPKNAKNNVSRTTANAVASIPGLTPSPSATQTLADQLKALQEENARLKAQAVTGATSVKLSEKGGISVYGLGRFPVTLYRKQWRKLIAEGIPAVEAFIAANEAKLDAVEAQHTAGKEAQRAAKATAAPATGQAQTLTAF